MDSRFLSFFKNYKFLLCGAEGEKNDKLLEELKQEVVGLREDLNTRTRRWEEMMLENEQKLQAVMKALDRAFSNVEKSKKQTIPLTVCVEERVAPLIFSTFSLDVLTSTAPLGFKEEDMGDVDYQDGIFVLEQISDTEARFWINPAPEAQCRCVGSFASLVKPACEVRAWKEGALMGIDTVEPGFLRKSDGVWAVERKVAVELK